ncbi:hypothetical protein Tco_0668772 [Tanacetum coccineum]
MQPGVIRLGKQNPQSSGDLHEQQRRSLGFPAEATLVNYGLVEVVACGVVEAAEVSSVALSGVQWRTTVLQLNCLITVLKCIRKKERQLQKPLLYKASNDALFFM